MIEYLTIQGFKSFDMDAPKLRLGALNFVVGANGSGKSNLLAALRFLRLALLEDLETATGAFSGIEEIRNLRLRQIKEPKPVIFEVSIRNPSPKADWSSEPIASEVRHICYRLVVNMRVDDGQPAIEEEIFRATISKAGGDPVQFVATRTRDTLHIHNPLATNGTVDIHQSITVLDRNKLIGATGFLGEPMAVFRNYIKSWRGYSISPDAARQPSEVTYGESMASNGERLGVILHEIEKKGDRDVMEAIRSGVRSFVPGFQDISPVELPIGRTKWGFKVKESGISRPLSPESISDGTVRLITMIVIAEWCARTSTLTTIEEPENGLHPHLTESIVGLFRSASEHGQVIITTHHAGFLDYLQPEELLLCAKDDAGNTTLRRAADSEDLKHFRKDFTLGEMMTMGLL